MAHKEYEAIRALAEATVAAVRETNTASLQTYAEIYWDSAKTKPTRLELGVGDVMVSLSVDDDGSLWAQLMPESRDATGLPQEMKWRPESAWSETLGPQEPNTYLMIDLIADVIALMCVQF